MAITIKYIDDTGSQNRNNHDNFFGQLVSTRQSIASYLERLYTKEQPLDKSPFELFGELLKKKREGIPDINIIFSDFNQWSPFKLQEANKLLNQLAKFTPFLYEERTTVWSKTGIGDYSYEMELELREKIEEFQQAINSTQIINKKLQSFLQIESLSNLESIETCYIAFSHVLKAPMKLPENWTDTNILTAQTALAKLKADLHTIENFEPRLKQKYSSELFSPDISQLSERYQKYSNFWFIRIFNHSYKNDLKRLNKLCISTNLASHHELKLDLAQAVRIQSLREELNKSNYPARQVFGSLFNPQISQKSELKPCEEALIWLIDLQRYSLSPNFVQQVVESPSHRQKLTQLIQQLESSKSQIKKGLCFLLSHFSESDIFP